MAAIDPEQALNDDDDEMADPDEMPDPDPNWNNWYEVFEEDMLNGNVMAYVYTPRVTADDINGLGDDTHLGGDQMSFLMDDYMDEELAKARFKKVVKAALKIQNPERRAEFFQGLARYLKDDIWARELHNGFETLPSDLQRQVLDVNEPAWQTWNDLLPEGRYAGADHELTSNSFQLEPPVPPPGGGAGADAAFVDLCRRD